MRTLSLVLSMIVALSAFSHQAQAKESTEVDSEKSCGTLNVVLPNRTINMTTGGTISASELAGVSSFMVKGTMVEFEVDTATFGIRNWTYLGNAVPGDLTGGKRIVIYKEKKVDHRGLALTGNVNIKSSEGWLVIDRSGTGISMKVQARDCTQGGVFQMEAQRGDGTPTRVTHILGDDVFFFDNPNFRAREGDKIPYEATTLTVASRINIGSDVASKLVGRDSPQEANRIPTNCPNNITKRDGTVQVVNHCGGRSDWDIKSGGRMGHVMGEDSIAVEPAQPVCTSKCRSRSRTQGAGTNIGFPSPVPASSRLNPRQ